MTHTYDALGRRLTEQTATATRHLYYSADWQVLEERVGGAPYAWYVWSPVYVDALVLRGRVGERLYRPILYSIVRGPAVGPVSDDIVDSYHRPRSVTNVLVPEPLFRGDMAAAVDPSA